MDTNHVLYFKAVAIFDKVCPGVKILQPSFDLNQAEKQANQAVQWKNLVAPKMQTNIFVLGVGALVEHDTRVGEGDSRKK